MSHIHFNLVCLGNPTNHVQNGWTHPEDRQGAGLLTPEYWCDIARTLERGRFDGLFFADVFSSAGAAPAAGYGPGMDPFALCTVMSTVTTHLGFVSTLATVGTPPYLAVRRIGTIDNLSGGRFGWNVVTSYNTSDFEVLGLKQPDHDVRYDQADEYMEIAYELWDAFPRDAIIMDKASGRYIDPAKMRRVDFDGEYYKSSGLPKIVQSPQGRPLIFQAGASPRGMRFAATHADAVFALQPRAAMGKYISDINAVADEIGRPHPKVFPGVQPYVGSTEAEAKQRVEELKERLPERAGVGMLEGLLGRKFSDEDLDKPIEVGKTDASQGWMAAIENWQDVYGSTLREMARDLAVSPGTPRIVGTPEQVADTLEEWWRDTGAYGFTISPNVMPDSIERFVDHVVPILQKRGLMRTEYAGSTFRENLLQQEDPAGATAREKVLQD